MKKDELLAIIALICNVVAFAIYNWQMLVGGSAPNIASWGIWSFGTILNFTSYRVMSGDWVKSLLPTSSSALCILTFVIAITRGRLAALNVYDEIALAIVIAVVIVWWWTESATKAQKLLQACGFVGFIPTYLSVWENPGNEPLLVWVIWTLMFMIQIEVVRLRWRGQRMDIVYPINLATLHLIVVVLLLL